MTSQEKIRFDILVSLLVRARNKLPTGPFSQEDIDNADFVMRQKMLLAVDIDTVFLALWNLEVLEEDYSKCEHPVAPAQHGVGGIL